MPVQMLVKNGTIVTPTSSMRGHLVIDEGKVVEMLFRDGSLPEAGTVIDAEGLHVLPGLIDPHVHFRVPGLDYKEDFDTRVAGGGVRRDHERDRHAQRQAADGRRGVL